MWRAGALGILGVNFCLGIKVWEVNFARALGFWQFFYPKMCNIDKKSDILAENFQLWHSKVHENLPSHEVLGTFCPGH